MIAFLTSINHVLVNLMVTVLLGTFLLCSAGFLLWIIVAAFALWRKSKKAEPLPPAKK